MSRPAAFRRRFRLPWRSRERIRAEVEEEIRFHLEMRAEELVRRGLPPAEALRRARREFGDVELARDSLRREDEVREAERRHRERWGELRQDLSLALRQLLRRPAFAAVSVLTLALGIGATTAIFALADHVLLRPLPYAEPERALAVWETDLRTGESRREVSPGNYLDWKERQRAFSHVGLAEPFGYDLTEGGTPLALDAWRVTEEFFAALGVRPLLGSGFRAEDFRPGAAPAVILSHGLWQGRFGSDPSIVGRAVRIDGAPATVLGVMPPWLEYPERTDLWAPKPFLPRELTERASGYMRVVARLRPGATPEQARADLDRVAASLAAEHPETNRHRGVALVPLEEQVVGGVRPALLLLLGAVGFLLLIACTNVAGLLLARGAEREHEMGVRAALGAGRARLARQLLTESALLGLVGGAAGVAMALVGVRLLVALSPPDLPRLDSVAVDGRVLGFALGATLLTALLFGLAPALRVSRASPLGALRGGAASVTSGRERVRFRSALVVAEIALATVLLIGAGLLARSFVRLLENDPGFVTGNVATLQLFLWDRNPTREQREQRVAEIVGRMEAVPGVEEVGVVSALPFHPQQIDPEDELLVEGRPLPAGGESPRVHTTIASPEYFAVMGIPVTRGRGFTAADRGDAPRVALVSETLARRLFPDEDPVGKRVTVGAMSAPASREIVGVVGDVRPTGLDSDPRAELFVPFAQSGNGAVTFVARTRTDPAPLLPALSAGVWEVDPLQTVDHASTLEGLIAGTLVERRFHLSLLAAFSAAALLLAAIGIYGLISFATRQRSREIGVRLALGAEPRRVVGMIVGEGLRLGLPGVLLGAGGALLLTRFMRGMLYGIGASDPATYLQLGALLLGVSVLGAYLPARRAARLDPVSTLRSD